MSQPEHARANQCALDRLTRELAPVLVYHSLLHTRDEVVPAVERLAALEGVAGRELALLRTAAYYHDLGFIEQAVNHELISIRMATEMLPAFGFTPAQVAHVGEMILATRLPQSPRDHLGAILADADLDLLGRPDFMARNHDLRTELAAFGNTVADEHWYRAQFQFLAGHRYFTPAAQRLRDAQKARNLALLAGLIAQPVP
ncbi:MAG TPA: phosphohydrolase [Chloroflexia bacterium]|nr:phosphohydrolase [Chloroflexia bacterium]